MNAELSTLFSLILIFWFIRNRALFEVSPVRDLWIVIVGALVPVVVFVMGIL